ncbi:MAG TPA: hypothetical protein VEI29_09705 [Burkholderiaceae bacterium]|nr:hypothetical protein [Burkholderiaceae bacterium]
MNIIALVSATGCGAYLAGRALRRTLPVIFTLKNTIALRTCTKTRVNESCWPLAQLRHSERNLPPVGATRNHKITREILKRFGLPIEACRFRLEQSVIHPRPGRSHFEHLASNPELIAGSKRSQPAKLLKPQADNVTCWLQVAFDQQPHGDRSGMPASGGKPIQKASARRGFIQVKRLLDRIRPQSS